MSTFDSFYLFLHFTDLITKPWHPDTFSVKICNSNNVSNYIFPFDMQHVFMCRGTEVIHVGHLLKFGISFYLPFIPAPRGTGVRAVGERGALCRTAVDPGVHSERG